MWFAKVGDNLYWISAAIREFTFGKNNALIPTNISQQLIARPVLPSDGTRAHSVLVVCHETNEHKLAFGQTLELTIDGIPFSFFSVRFVLCGSGLSPEHVQRYESYAQRMDFEITREWNDSVTHLMVSTLLLTQKALAAVQNAVPIVSTYFLRHFTKYYSSINHGETIQPFVLPNANKFLPQKNDSGFDSQLWLPHARRKTLFEGSKFYVIPKLFETVKDYVCPSGGEVVCCNYEDGEVVSDGYAVGGNNGSESVTINDIIGAIFKVSLDGLPNIPKINEPASPLVVEKPTSSVNSKDTNLGKWISLKGKKHSDGQSKMKVRSVDVGILNKSKQKPTFIKQQFAGKGGMPTVLDTVAVKVDPTANTVEPWLLENETRAAKRSKTVVSVEEEPRQEKVQVAEKENMAETNQTAVTSIELDLPRPKGTKRGLARWLT